MPALESLVDAVRELEAELAQARHHLSTPTPPDLANVEPPDADAAEWMNAPMGPLSPIRHGTLDGYKNHYCRCDECRAANSAYMRAYYHRRKAKSGAA